MTSTFNQNTTFADAIALHNAAILHYQGRPVGTIAAQDSERDALNYDQCFVRDFVPSALVFLMQGKAETVRNFLEVTLTLQSHEKGMDYFQPEAGLMPASFKVIHADGEDHLSADFGEQAIARVPPVDASLWWLILLRAYGKATGDVALAQQPQFQAGIHLILDVCLAHRFSLYPTLIVPDGAFMIDRRLGVSGHPLEVQVLFYMALRAAQELLLESDCPQPAIGHRLSALHYHVREYYWLDLQRLNEIYRFQVNEYGETIANKFNIHPESIPTRLTEWLPETGGYLVGNLGPGQMDFRCFTLGNLLAILAALANESETQSILNLFEQRWHDLIGAMPVKICFPAIEGTEWRILTGCDPKNSPWSYHNGGNWPVLLWAFVAAALKGGRPELAERAITLAQPRLLYDDFPEYYDGRNGRLIGKEARRQQTWSVAALLTAHELLANPQYLDWLCFDELGSAARG